MEIEASFLYIYNVGSKFSGDELKGLLKNPEDFSKYEYARPTPEEIPTFNLPSIFNLKDESIAITDKQYRLKVQAAIYGTGSISIRVRLKENLTEQQVKKLAFDKKLKDDIAAIAERAISKVEKSLAKIKSISLSSYKEGYAFYYLNAEKEKVLAQYRKLIAGLLIDEADAENLDEQYVSDVLNKNITYSSNDILFVGWESAFMIDNTGSVEYELIVSEIANIQLLEMQIYNKMLSNEIRETDDMIRRVLEREPFGGKELLRANMRLSNSYDKISEMSNAARSAVSGFGEWYLSRLYGLFFDVFKLGEWQAQLSSGLEVIEKRRDSIIEATRSHRMDMLEIIVILLIVVEIVLEALFIVLK